MRYRPGLLFLVALFVALLGRATGPDLSAELSRDLASMIVDLVQLAGVRTGTLAIGEITAEGGSRFRDLLREELARRTDLALVEPSRVDHLPGAERFPGGVSPDSRARIRQGERLGADGLLVASVTPARQDWLGRWKAGARVRLYDLHDGHVIVSAQPSSERVAPWNLSFFLAALAIAVLSAAGALTRRDGRHRPLRPHPGGSSANREPS